jgi:type IV pilus assembly protein PilC
MQEADRIFIYKGKTGNGKSVTGDIKASNERAALVLLRDRVSAIFELKEAAEITPAVSSASESTILIKGRKYRLNLAEKAFLLYQLSSMLNAGIDLVGAVEAMGAEHEDKNVRAMMRDIAMRMRGGEDFSQAISHYPTVFDDVLISVIRAGEESGKLNEVLAYMSRQFERLYQIRSQTISALAYPVFVMLVAVCVIVLMLVKVIPMFEDIYSSFGASLPLATRMLLSMSHAIRDHFIITGIFAALLTGLGVYLWKQPESRMKIETVIYRIPVVGNILEEYIWVRMTRMLALLIGSGLNIIESISFTASSIGWLQYRRRLHNTLDGVRQGLGIAEQFRRQGVLPAMAGRMIKVGEDTGRLDDMLDKVADFYELRVENKIKMLSSLLEPILIVFLGGVVGLILVAMYMPVFMLGRAMKGH